jgi:hypothetical protein
MQTCNPDAAPTFQLVKLSPVADKEDLPLEKRRLVALAEVRRLQKSTTVHGRVLLREFWRAQGDCGLLITQLV